MEKPWEVKDKRVLLLSDIHQRIEWATAVLDKESGNFDQIVFLGDIFDSFEDPPKVAGVKETARWYKDLIHGKFGPAICLQSNHDLPYMEACFQLRKSYTIKHLNNTCSGFTKNKAQKINDVFSWDDWRKTQIFVVANGFLISHAGFRENNWRPFADTDKNLNLLFKESAEALELVSFKPSHFFSAGEARDGRDRWGGPLWLDWDTEFEDNLPLPQIVGHTTKYNTVRQIGSSFCIDGQQSCYAIISESGQIEFKSIYKSIFADTWIEQKPIRRNDDDWVSAREHTVNVSLLGDKPVEGFKY